MIARDARARAAGTALASWTAIVSMSCSGMGATERGLGSAVVAEAGTTVIAEAGATSDSVVSPGALDASADPPRPPILVPAARLDPARILQAGCATATVRSQLVPVNLLFVLDRSGTMNCNLPPTTDFQTCERDPRRADPSRPSKWEITQQALVEALEQLPPASKVGLSYFSQDDICGVGAAPDVPLNALDTNHRLALETSLANVRPNGGTPLVGATLLAYQHLHGLALAHAISGNSFVVLLTDGEQSDQCSEGSRCRTARECTALLTDQEVPKAAGPGVGIRTFVLGAPGSEPARSTLSRIALRGGTAAPGCDADAGACHFDMTRQSDFASALTGALATISGKVVTCELPLPESPGVPLDRDLVNVILTSGDGSSGRVIPRDLRATCDQGVEGWRYTQDLSRIELCAALCGKVRGDPAARLDIVLGCPVPTLL